MSNTTFIIGGARSGKSSYALELSSTMPGRKGFLATAEALDEEMRERILVHQKARPSEWETIEEPVNICKRLHEIDTLYDVIIVDCLTLWLSNMLAREEDSEKENPPLSPFFKGGNIIYPPLEKGGWGDLMRGCSKERIKAEVEQLSSVLRDVTCKVIVVSNEVGLGIVPENNLARLFRDLGGWMNQKVAAAAGEVYLVTCGIPMRIK